MNTFLVQIILPDEFSPTFYSLIPKQRKVTSDLMKRKIIQCYSLDMDRKNVWAVINAKNEQKVMDILSTFPIIQFVKISIHELAFHLTAEAVPDLIMN